MKQLQKLFCLFLIAFSITSCGGGSAGNCDAFSTQGSAILNSEISAISTAALQYSEDPSPANCQNYKSAFTKYVDAIEDLYDCASQFGQGAEFDTSLAEARKSISELEC